VIVPHTTPMGALARHMEVEMKLFVIACLTVTVAFSQAAESRSPITDADKIVDALRAGPVFITTHATLLD